MPLPFSSFSNPLPQRMKRAKFIGLLQLSVHLCTVVVVAFSSTCFADESAKYADAAEYTVTKDEGSYTILRNGRPVAEYLNFSGAKPVFAALRGPDGEQLTRNYPIGDALPAEKQDHIHHRSMWFTHGEVNGVDFWAETPNHGTIVPTSEDISAQPEGVVLKTANDWLDAGKKRILSDKRMFTFHDVGKMHAIDCVIELIASDGPVVFGDTKEGSFGIRVAGTMKVDAKMGGKIVSSRGLVNGDAWGKPAEWVDYYGPVGEGTSGIAILNHPTSFGFPTRWHVRTYGLFAANPFGVSHFTGGEATEGVKLEKGETLTLKYQVLLHRGTTEEAEIAKAWETYSK